MTSTTYEHHPDGYQMRQCGGRGELTLTPPDEPACCDACAAPYHSMNLNEGGPESY